MGDGISEMANFLTETFQSRYGGQSDEVVSDRQNRPVCLDACPGTHKHFPEAEMLLDVLVKSLDGKALGINFDHLGFGHLQIVGDKETVSAARAGNKKPDLPDLRQPNQAGSDSEVLLFGNPDAFVSPRSLGQKRHGSFDAVQENISILFESGYENPARLLNGIENRSATIPSIHDDGKSLGKKEKSFAENLQSKSDLAFENAWSAGFLGAVSSKSKDQTQRAGFQKRCDGTHPFDQSLAGMMKSETLNAFSFSWSQSIVEDQENILGFLENHLAAFGNHLSKFGCDVRGVFYKVVKSVGVALAEVVGDFPDRAEFDQRNQAGQIGQEVGLLRFGQNLQEMLQMGRNCFRAMFAHGLRVLRGLVSIGDFDRKPFYLKWVSSFFT